MCRRTLTTIMTAALGAMTMTGADPVDVYQWQQVTLEAPFAARDGAGLLSFQGRLWLLGGWNPRDKQHFPRICNSEVWASEDGVNWTLVCAQAPWEGRHTAGYAVHRGRMWIIGGDCNQGHYQPDVWSSADGVDWELVCAETPWGRRALHHTVAFDGKLWVIGGQTMPGFVHDDDSEVFHNDVWRSEDGADWTCVTEHAPWPARGMIGGCAVKVNPPLVINEEGLREGLEVLEQIAAEGL